MSDETVDLEARKVAREARKIAVSSMDRANEAVSIATANRASLIELERRVDDGHGRIMNELAAIREAQTFLIQWLTKQANKAGG
jgi:hypothetical protein